MSHSYYRGALLKGLCSYGRRHRAILAQLPGVDGEKVFGGPHPLIDQISSIVEFDRCITAPHFGFNSPEEYYRAADCFVSLETTQTPIMCITARDDPICGRPPKIRRWEKLANINSNVVYVEMPSGGHIGFLGNPVAELRQLPNAGERLVLQGIEGFCKKLEGN
ncbi:hypothetical protein DQ04_01161090 [Trypanosoma grayi]|uniref:hypothetical protein n=1 Tax=Trypanosoma grayi TaxID=71804 RepID=UPI0004F40940|nr:hypothetical protein DQ04_01161090 [Trypanosoma grayi]KEG13191.1 hypothetical protein DQ04_01161090 [Trypanosoma grayi]